MSQPLASLAQEYLETSTVADPLTASVFGVPGADRLLPDLSEEGEAASAVKLLDIASRAEAVPVHGLDDADRVSRAVLVHAARQGATTLTDRYTEFSVSGYVSAAAGVLVQVSKTVLDSADAEDAYVARLSALPQMLDQVGERGLAGVARGTTPARSGVVQLVGQLETYLSGAVDADPLLGPARGTAVEDRVRSLLAEEVRPAYAAYREVLAGTVLDAARSDEQCGMTHVPGGQGIYERAAAMHTTTSRTPEEIHQLGLDLCAGLRDEYADLGQRVFGTSDFQAVTDRLRHDPELRYSTPEEIVADVERAQERAEHALGTWFRKLYKAPCTVEEMSELEAPTSVLAYYRPPTGGRPGQQWINTYQPHTRTRYEYETLSFHESVPGHHFQFALAQELEDVPEFRRYLYVTAFSEGWGLYTERLADEMGLYSSELARFGMLSFDSWRACRLVVDTGMHLHGWSRQQAVDFMLANSALTPENISNEVDRYIAWPGQALAYMVGRLEIQDLRRRAEARLGTAFDLPGFHDTVLGNGCVPLGVLADEVDHWAAAVAAS